jgi:hypothetical protein
MSPRPGRIADVIKMDACRPRDPDSPENVEVSRRVREVLHLPSAVRKIPSLVQ